MMYRSYCLVCDKTKFTKGLFAKFRDRMWWKKHDKHCTGMRRVKFGDHVTYGN